MRRAIKESIKTIFQALGYEVTRIKGHGPRESRFPSDPVLAQKRLLIDYHRDALTIFDVGANKGQSAEGYRKGFPNANIFCFEPFPDSIITLQKNFANDPKIHVVPKAVSDEAGRKTFFVNAFDATNSLLPRPTSDRRYYPQTAGPKTTIEVEVVTLDDFVAANGIEHIDILKFDVQGGELKALEGARSLLKAGSVELIYTEIMFVPHYEGGAFFYEIWEYLADLGYSLFNIYDLHKAANGQVRYGDALFVSDNIRKNVINSFPEEP